MEKIIKASLLALSIVASITLINAVADYKFDRLIAKQDLTNPEVITVKQRERQLECLAINIYREAGYEPFEGKVAVAQVTLNRARHPDFPHDVCAVVYQKNVMYSKVVCQFSWYCDNSHRTRPINREAYNESYAVAKKVLLENFRLDGLRDALYYHADYVNPQWQLDRIGKIGQHIFYKPRKGNKNGEA
jgi:spore germination cell wall hydrolase CwlJ-like protein